MKILLTGFKPFNGRTVNPAELLLGAVKAPEGVLVIKKLLPVEFRQAEKELKQIVEKELPDIILSLGQAGNVPWISIESTAVNKDNCLSSDGKKVLPDMAGYAPIDEPIVSGGPAAYFSKLPIRKLLNKVSETGVKAGISYSAGTYVCNHVMYTGCYLAEQYEGMQAGFVHVPFLPEQLDGRTEMDGRYSMPFSDMLLGVQTIIDELAAEAGRREKSEFKRKKDFKKFIRKSSAVSLAGAGLLAAAFTTGLLAIILRQISGAAGVLVYTALALVFLYINKKETRYFAASWVQPSAELQQEFNKRLDKCKKRCINSFFVLLFAAACFILITFARASATHLNYDELLVLIESEVYMINLAVLLLIKNYLDLNILLEGVAKEEKDQFRQYIKKQMILLGGAVILDLLLAFLWNLVLENALTAFSLLLMFTVLIGAVISFDKRKRLVRNNLVYNKPVITCACMLAAVSVLLNFLKKDVYILQPYITTVPAVSHNSHEINYDENSGEYTIKAGEDDFRILHLTDIHLGGSITSSYKDYLALNACRRLIEAEKPDFVIVTGDLVFPVGVMSFSFNNEAPVVEFASFMRNIGIPWAFTYGNHDTEDLATGNEEDIEKLFRALSYRTSGSLLYPYTQPYITGRNNQLIRIENPDGSIRQALFLLDSNDYTGQGLNDYDYIHDDQVEWYEKKVKELSEEQGELISSMLFFHMPLQEYRTAYELYEQNSSEVTYYFGIAGEEMIDKICCSDYPSRLFDTALELGSTKAMFCGHDHYNNISLEYKGIRLTYGMSIDYLAMPGIDKRTEQRGAEVITLKPDAGFEIEQIPLDSLDR